MQFNVKVRAEDMLKQQQKSKKGFTLIELLIILVIIGVLAAIAVPAYQSHMRKARFAEVTRAAAGLRHQVDMCIMTLDTTEGCNGGSNGIRVPGVNPSPYVNTITVANGKITVTPNTLNGITGQNTLILTPIHTAGSNKIPLWQVSGGCVTAGLCKAGTP
jgi:type IV pilus assembly protein PilA